MDDGEIDVNRAVVATAALAAMWAGIASAETSKPASFFVEGKPNANLLSAVRQGTSQNITFNRHFSSAEVSCGPGCNSYWFVDRQTGGVVGVPESLADDQMIWDVRAQPTNDTITVTYGRRDGVAGKCVARHFRLTGQSFVALDKPSSAKCPS